MAKSFIFLGLTIFAMTFISLCAWLFSMPSVYPIALPSVTAILLVGIIPIAFAFGQNWKEALFNRLPLLFLLFALGIVVFWMIGKCSTFLFPPINDGIAAIYGLLTLFISFFFLLALLVVVHIIALIINEKGVSRKTSFLILCNLLVSAGLQILTLKFVQHICGA